MAHYDPVGQDGRCAHYADWQGPGGSPRPLSPPVLSIRKWSFGDFVAVSEPVDLSLARISRRVESDGIVAPGFEPGTEEMPSANNGGRFLVMEPTPLATGSLSFAFWLLFPMLGFAMLPTHQHRQVLRVRRRT